MSNKIDKLRREVEKYLPCTPDISQKVLVIDDEFRNLRTFKSQFRKRAKVFTAENLDQALNVLRSNKIDIILCDYRMPNKNGAEVLSEIIKEFPDIRRLALTAYSDAETRKEFKEKAKTTEFIFKPYSFNEVYSAIYSYS